MRPKGGCIYIMNFDCHFVSGGNWGGFVYLIYKLFLRFVIVHREFQDGEDCVTDVCRFGVKKKEKKEQKSFGKFSFVFFSNSLLFNPQPIYKKKMATNITFHPGKQSPPT